MPIEFWLINLSFKGWCSDRCNRDCVVQSIEVLVDSCATEGGVALELLDGRLGPPSEGLKVREGGIVVVVGIPQLLGRNAGAGREASHDGLPHVPRRVDGGNLTVTLDPVDRLSKEGAVAVVVGSPSAPRAGVCLHVDPDHAVEVCRDGCHHLVDLGRGRLAPAGEHVDVSDESCGAGVVEVVDDIGINSAVGAVAADDGEGIAVAFHALVGGSGEELADVHAQRAEGGHDQQKCQEQFIHQ